MELQRSPWRRADGRGPRIGGIQYQGGREAYGIMFSCPVEQQTLDYKQRLVVVAVAELRNVDFYVEMSVEILVCDSDCWSSSSSSS